MELKAKANQGLLQPPEDRKRQKDYSLEPLEGEWTLILGFTLQNCESIEKFLLF